MSNPVTPLWFADLQNVEIVERNWLWHGYLAAGNVTLLTSQWKTGKTTLLAILLPHMKKGGTLAGLPIRAGTAVVLSEEGPEQWKLRGQRFGYKKQVCWFCRPFRGKPTLEQWHGLIEQILRLHQLLRLHQQLSRPGRDGQPRRGLDFASVGIGICSAVDKLHRLKRHVTVAGVSAAALAAAMALC